MTPTFAVVGCLRLLDREPFSPVAVAEFVRQNHPLRRENPETQRHTDDPKVFVYQQIQTLRWLGEDVSAFELEVRNWFLPSEYPRRYELRGYPIFSGQMLALHLSAVTGIASFGERGPVGRLPTFPRATEWFLQQHAGGRRN